MPNTIFSPSYSSIHFYPVWIKPPGLLQIIIYTFVTHKIILWHVLHFLFVNVYVILCEIDNVWINVVHST
jgi:hypothetical protein